MSRQCYAKLHTLREGKPVEMLASDSIFYLDGRWGSRRIDAEVRKQAKRLESLGKQVSGYIVCGPTHHPRTLYISILEVQA